jgi:HlyD family secretion protein
MKPLAAMLPVLLACAALAGCQRNDPNHLAVTGQIEGTGVDAGTRLGGRVMEVRVEEGDTVKAGDVLVCLEPYEAEAAVYAARAKVAQAEATLEKLRTGATAEQLRQAEAAVAQARERYEMAKRGARTQERRQAEAGVAAARALRDQRRSDYERLRKLYEQDAISEQQYEQARTAYEAAEAEYQRVAQQANLVEEGPREEEIGMAKAALDQAQAMLDELRVGARKEDIQAAEAALNAAKADLARAETALKEMVVVSPRDGVVESVDVEAGDLVKPGPVVRIVDPDDLELRVYVSAGALGRIRLGQKVPITTDSLGDETFEGTVAQIATEGEYTPRNLQTEEERVQQVFGVKIDLRSYEGKLKAGMSATAHFDFSEPAA